MKIIIAPAKKMIVDTDTFPQDTLPQYLTQTKLILKKLHTLSYSETKTLWACSDHLAHPNYQQLQETLDLTQRLTPAILSFSGIQYQYMAPDIFTTPALDYIRENLRILSGFYGILRPFDGVVPYRLEMQAKLAVAGSKNLYDFWGNQLYQALTNTQEPILNLASLEYSKTIRPYIAPTQPFVTIVFGSIVHGKLKTKATLAKMARGEMVRFLAERQITELEEVKTFEHPNFSFDPKRSTSEEFVFVSKK